MAVNLNKYRGQPKHRDGHEADPDATPQQIEQIYMSNVGSNLLVRASHPLIAVEPITTLGSQGDSARSEWDIASFIRYRSRADFLAFLFEADWSEDVEHRRAALEGNHHLPATPRVTLVGVRLVPFLLLVCIGLLLDRFFGEGPVRQPEYTNQGLLVERACSALLRSSQLRAIWASSEDRWRRPLVC